MYLLAEKGSCTVGTGIDYPWAALYDENPVTWLDVSVDSTVVDWVVGSALPRARVIAGIINLSVTDFACVAVEAVWVEGARSYADVVTVGTVISRFESCRSNDGAESVDSHGINLYKRTGTIPDRNSPHIVDWASSSGVSSTSFEHSCMVVVEIGVATDHCDR